VLFFIYGLDPSSSCELAGVGVCFIFYPWVIRGYLKFQILMVSTQAGHLNSCQSQSFSLAQHYPLLKSHTVILGGVHLSHQLCFFFWFFNTSCTYN
jgi:hypothetical protein